MPPIAQPHRQAPSPPWWLRPGLRYRRRRLFMGSQDLEALARESGRPTYAYHGGRIRENLSRLRRALRRHAPGARIFYAMKSNRFVPLLRILRSEGGCGIDACSPREVLLALRAGFPETAISYTGTSVSDDDLALLRRHPGIWVNCDSISALRRLGRLMPGREVGLRVNPGLGVGYRANRLLRYAGAGTTKFGIYAGEFGEALRTAAEFRLRVTGLHVHSGCGFLTPQLPAWERMLSVTLEFAERVPGLRHLNVGGGLGIPLVAADKPLNLEKWAGILARRVAGRGLQVWVEPGDYIAKDCGVLLLQVNTVERKNGVLFAGVNGGFNLHPEPAFYRLPLETVPCREP